MIVGNGLLAKVFSHLYTDRSDVTIFASGVSNSTETRQEAFERERRMLLENLDGPCAKFVYFGSCAVGNPHETITPYLTHKSAMESLALSSGKAIILRLPQVVGRSSNTNTLTNFLYHKIVSGEHFAVWSQAERNLIDVDDVVSISSFIIEKQWINSLVAPIAALKSSPMPLIVDSFERTLNKKANYSLINKGAPFPIDTSITEKVCDHIHINLNDGYLDRILAKYYLNTN